MNDLDAFNQAWQTYSETTDIPSTAITKKYSYNLLSIYKDGFRAGMKYQELKDKN